MQEKTNEQLVAEFQAGDRSALDVLLKRNSGLVWKVALKAAGGEEGERFDDIFQELQISFCRSVELFDCGKGTRFSTYVMNSMKYRVIQLWQALKRKGRSQPLVSLEAPCGKNLRLVQVLKDKKHAPCEDSVLQGEDLSQVNEAMRNLSQRSREIVRLRMEGVALTVIGEQFGITKERVRQIEAKSLTKLRVLLGQSPPAPRATGKDRLIVKLFQDGHIPRVIGERLGLSTCTIRRKLKRLGICKDCRAKKRSQRSQGMKRYRQRRYENGKCQSCPSPRLKGSVLCEECRQKKRDYMRAYNERKKGAT